MVHPKKALAACAKSVVHSKVVGNCQQTFLLVNIQTAAVDAILCKHAHCCSTTTLCRYEQYVEDAYVEYLKQENRPDEVCMCTIVSPLCTQCYPQLLTSLPFLPPIPFVLRSPPLPSLHPLPTPPSPLPFLHSQMQAVDPDSALRMYANSKQWDKCLELAYKQVQILNSDLPDMHSCGKVIPPTPHTKAISIIV